MRFGIQMMKYSINHPDEFSNHIVAALFGFFYAVAIMLLTMACIIKMCTEYALLDILNSYISYGIIVFIPNFAYAALPVGHILKAPSENLVIKRRRRFIHSRTCGMWVLRVIYKGIRLFYSCFWYYFLPITACMLPFV